MVGPAIPGVVSSTDGTKVHDYTLDELAQLQHQVYVCPFARLGSRVVAHGSGAYRYLKDQVLTYLSQQPASVQSHETIASFLRDVSLM
jgi:hypothetical protein